MVPMKFEFCEWNCSTLVPPGAECMAVDVIKYAHVDSVYSALKNVDEGAHHRPHVAQQRQHFGVTPTADQVLELSSANGGNT